MRYLGKSTENCLRDRLWDCLWPCPFVCFSDRIKYHLWDRIGFGLMFRLWTRLSDRLRNHLEGETK